MKISKAFLIFVSLLLVVYPPSPTASCGFGLSVEDYRFYLFQPDAGNDKSLLPFFYSSEQFYTPPGAYLWDFFDGRTDFTDHSKNLNEWHKYLGGSVPVESIKKVLYNMDPQEYFAWETGTKNNEPFLNALAKPQYKEAYQYMHLAKACEQVRWNENPWKCYDCYTEEEILNDPARYEKEISSNDTTVSVSDYSDYYSHYRDDKDEPDNEVAEIMKITENAEALFDKVISPEIKTRLAFQLVKLSFMMDDEEGMVRIYKEHLEHAPGDPWSKWAALLYILERKRDPSFGYQLSLIFRKCPDKRFRCQQLFDPAGMKTHLSFAKTNEEKATLYAMQALQYPGRSIESLKNMYALNPADGLLNMLLVREINKIENWLLTGKLTEFQPVASEYYDATNYTTVYRYRNYASDIEYAGELELFLNTLIQGGRRDDLAFLHTCAGYIGYLAGNYKEAELHYTLADQHKASPEVSAQHTLCKLMLQVSSRPVIGPEEEQLIAAYVKSLDDASNSFVAKKELKSQFMLFIADAYKSKGQVARSVLAIGQTNSVFGEIAWTWVKTPYHYLLEIAGPDDYDELATLLAKKDKTPCEELLTSPMKANTYYDYYEPDTVGEPWNVNKVLDLKVTCYVRRNDIKAAYKAACSIPDSYWKEEPYQYFKDDNPFEVSLYNGHKAWLVENKKYNKRTYLQEMLELEKQAAKSTGDEKAKCLYKLANAYFSMTFYGKYWIMNQTWATHHYEPERTPYNDVFYGCSIAKQYYLRAFDAAKNEQLAAYSCLMAGLCDNFYRSYTASHEYYYSIADAHVFENNPYRKEYTKRFKGSRKYDEALTNCGLIYDFIKWVN